MSDAYIPAHPDAVTSAWLTKVFRKSRLIDSDTSVTSVEQSDPGREASYAGLVTRLLLTYDREPSDAPKTVIAKFPASETIIRFLFKSIYRTEFRFYRELAGTVSISVPDCYRAMMNQRGTRSLLLLEDLAPVATLGNHDEGCTTEQASLAISRLGRLHAQWWETPDLREIDWLSTYTTVSGRNWLIYAGAWLPYQRRLRHATPPRTGWLMANLWRYRRRLSELEEGRPLSLQHGDFRLANLAFSQDDVYVFDWQVVRRGLPHFDLAWFMITSLTVEQRRKAETDLLQSYYSALVDSGVRGYSMDDLNHDFRLGLLLIIPQIMVIGAFLRFDDQRQRMLALLLERYEAAAKDNDLKGLLGGS